MLFGGECQCLVIVCVLFMDVLILLLDEFILLFDGVNEQWMWEVIDVVFID